MNYKKYTLSNSKYTTEQIKEACEIIEEISMIKSRLKKLNSILESNKEIKKEIWVTQDGKAEPIALLENSHLENIAQYLERHGCDIPLRILDEIEERKQNRTISIPATEELGEMPF